MELVMSADFSDLLPRSYSLSRIRQLTILQAVTGIPTLVKPLDLTKSSGYPYCIQGLNRSQVMFAGSEIAPAFAVKVDTLYNTLAQGAQSMMCVSSLKDELLSFEKLAAHKLRMFWIGQLEHLILYRQFMDTWWTEMQSQPFDTPISIGLNPHSHQWTLLYDRLSEARSSDGVCHTMAGDFAAFEFTIPPEFVYSFVHFVETVYPMFGTDAVVRRNLLYSTLWPYHVLGKRVYKFDSGQSSGNGLTACFASYCSWLFHKLAWLYLNLSEKEWKRCVRCAFTGDDSVVVVKDHPEYNMMYLSEFARFLGMVYTTNTKGETSVPYITLDEAVYLKRGFKPLNGFVYAPLEITSILECPMWTNGACNHRDQNGDIANMFRCMLLESVHHSRELYDIIHKVAYAWSREIGIHFTPPSYETTINKLRRNGFEPGDTGNEYYSL
jgi:hypothetical protein